eukprot:5694086-Pyramimonas_sp.AAC.1
MHSDRLLGGSLREHGVFQSAGKKQVAPHFSGPGAHWATKTAFTYGAHDLSGQVLPAAPCLGTLFSTSG